MFADSRAIGRIHLGALCETTRSDYG